MGTAEKVLIVGGVSILSYGFLLGIPLSMIRMKSPQAPRYLITAHLAAIIQGALLLGLSRATQLSDLSPTLETTAAALFVVGVSFFVVGATLDWLQNIGDHFAERSLGWKLLAISGPINISAAAIFLVGVSRGV